MINFPVKGVGLKLMEIPREGNIPSYLITDENGWRVTNLDFLDYSQPDSQALEIMRLIQEASRLGFEQGLASVRAAMGVMDCGVRK